jgi:F0F1-type ATP synthase assembly protein I
MFSFYDFLTFLAELLQMLGLLIFGVAAGWFTMYAFRERPWQLQIAVFLGFFLLAAIITYTTPASGVGAFALGSGAAMLFWGVRNQKKSEDEEKTEE